VSMSTNTPRLRKHLGGITPTRRKDAVDTARIESMREARILNREAKIAQVHDNIEISRESLRRSKADREMTRINQIRQREMETQEKKRTEAGLVEFHRAEIQKQKAWERDKLVESLRHSEFERRRRILSREAETQRRAEQRLVEREWRREREAAVRAEEEKERAEMRRRNEERCAEEERDRRRKVETRKKEAQERALRRKIERQWEAKEHSVGRLATSRFDPDSFNVQRAANMRREELKGERVDQRRERGEWINAVRRSRAEERAQDAEEQRSRREGRSE